MQGNGRVQACDGQPSRRNMKWSTRAKSPLEQVGMAALVSVSLFYQIGHLVDFSLKSTRHVNRVFDRSQARFFFMLWTLLNRVPHRTRFGVIPPNACD